MVGDLLGLRHPAGRQHVGVDHVEGAGLDRLAKSLEQIQILARRHRRQQRVRHLPVTCDVGPGQHVLDPRKVERLDRPADPDRLVGGDEALAEMVGAERDPRPHLRAHRPADLAHQLEPTLGDPRARTAAGGVELPVLRILVLGVAAHQRVGMALEHVRGEVELDEGEADVAPRADDVGEAFGRGIVRRRRVAVDPDPVAELAAEKLIAGHAVDLADQIHQRDLDGADPAGLSALAAIALDAPEDVLDVARVLSDDQRLEPERGIGMRSVPDLAEAVEVLVGVDPHDRVQALRPDGGHPDVGDPQLRGFRRATHGVLAGSTPRAVFTGHVDTSPMDAGWFARS